MMQTIEYISSVNRSWVETVINRLREQSPEVADEISFAADDPQMSLGMWVQKLEAFAEQGVNLMSLGMLTAVHLYNTLRFNSLREALTRFAELYDENHVGLMAGKGFVTSSASEDAMIVKTETPYPDDFEYGLIYGLTYVCQPFEADAQVEQYHTLENGSCCTGRTYMITLT